MPRNPRRPHGEDLRAASKLVIDATTGVMGVVEKMHATIASGPKVLGQPLSAPAGLMTGLVYGTIRGVTRAVGATIDRALAQLTPLLGESAPGPERLAVLSALNGVLGDLLARTGNPLALPMELCRAGEPLELTREALAAALPEASRQVLVLVHGSSMNDLQWSRQGQELGALLERELGCTAVHVRYNTGLHVSQNGELLAALLEQVLAAWPVKPKGLTLLTHSMGGLVARAACHSAQAHSHRWLGRLDSLVFLGTPHHGAPLEKSGNVLDTLLGVSRYSAPLAALGKIRSAGVTDLRFGTVLEADWQGRDRFQLGRDRRTPLPLPEGVACYAMAASLSLEDGPRRRGDGLVPVDSALGLSAKPRVALDFPPGHTHVLYGANHLDLLSRPEVAQVVLSWLSKDP